MDTTSATLRGKVEILVKEYGDGTPWIVLETNREDFPILGGGFAGFDLKPGTTYEQAKEIARYLREHIADFSVTIFTAAAPSNAIH